MKNNEDIDLIIKKHSESLISILQGIQKKYGYLSFENLYYLSNKLDVSLEHIYSVASFVRNGLLGKRFQWNIRRNY